MTAAAVAAARPVRRSTPSTRDAAASWDAVAVLLLTGCALLELAGTYPGWQFLVAGIAGTGIGIAVAAVGRLLRLPVIAVVALGFVGFLIAGGPLALRGSDTGWAPYRLGTLSLLARTGIHGWKQLLTTAPPLDGTGPLLVLPYALGLGAGLVGLTLARRSALAAVPVAAPAAVLVAAILLGTSGPGGRVLLAAAFAGGAVAWICLRHQRQRPAASTGSARAFRTVTGTVLLVVTAAGTAGLGAVVPNLSTHSRVVLRTYVQPPLDVSDYTSPLAAFRVFTKGPDLLYSRTLLTVHGLPAGSPIVIATLDGYDGTVWRATDATTPTVAGVPADVFERVGSRIATPLAGQPATVTVTVNASYAADTDLAAWVPAAGQASSLTFGTADPTADTDVRYNRATGTALLPSRLSSNQSYRFTTVLQAARAPEAGDRPAADAVTAGTAFVHDRAAAWAAGATTPIAQVLAVASHLKSSGIVSSGDCGNPTCRPGQSVGRLTDFLDNPELVGSDEQYAATLALMANALGVPARVVLGAVPEAGGVVEGRDMHAWVQLQVADGTWRTLPPQAFLPTATKPAAPSPQSARDSHTSVVQPPSAQLPDALAAGGQVAAQTSSARTPAVRSPARLGRRIAVVVAWTVGPVALVVLSAAAVIAAKGIRRRRRRRRGEPGTRIAAGWREVLDRAVDLGDAVRTRATRREQANDLGGGMLTELAAMADGLVFGALYPIEDDAEEFWAAVDEALGELSRGVSRPRRLWAAVTPRSLSALLWFCRRTAEPWASAVPARPARHAAAS